MCGGERGDGGERGEGGHLLRASPERDCGHAHTSPTLRTSPGTYSLENFGRWPTPGPNCGNWCIQGPFCSIRTSTDSGVTWTAPRRNMTGYSDNIFGETAFNNSKVKVSFMLASTRSPTSAAP